MSIAIRSLCITAVLLAAAVMLAQQPATPAPSGSPAAHAADPQQGTVKNTTDMQFVHFPGVPDCTTGAVEHGHPTSGPSVILLKSAERCTIPMHFHTANEQLMIVSGVGQLQMQGQQPQSVSAGGYAFLPSQHPHQMTCATGCTLYLTSDAAFDIHYVDANGSEIPVDKALSAVGERASTPMPMK
jgi:quercetin dioxygenase-like cupin family protein